MLINGVIGSYWWIPLLSGLYGRVIPYHLRSTFISRIQMTKFSFEERLCQFHKIFDGPLILSWTFSSRCPSFKSSVSKGHSDGLWDPNLTPLWTRKDQGHTVPQFRNLMRTCQGFFILNFSHLMLCICCLLKNMLQAVRVGRLTLPWWPPRRQWCHYRGAAHNEWHTQVDDMLNS